MREPTDIPVIILAGGASRRFGTPKGVADINGRRLIDLVIQRMQVQTRAQVAINAAATGIYSELGLDMVPDQLGDQLGPLAGLHAGMLWAQEQGYDCLATVAIDMPHLPSNMLSVLRLCGAPAIAASRGREHFVCGLWPAGLAEALEAFVKSGQRAAGAWARECEATVVHFSDDAYGRDPFFNVNTRKDLAKVAGR
ncbi:MAG: molybdenum cofactor guanylyltransferase [Pseudomonadota bacterium]